MFFVSGVIILLDVDTSLIVDFIPDAFERSALTWRTP